MFKHTAIYTLLSLSTATAALAGDSHLAIENNSQISQQSNSSITLDSESAGLSLSAQNSAATTSSATVFSAANDSAAGVTIDLNASVDVTADSRSASQRTSAALAHSARGTIRAGQVVTDKGSTVKSGLQQDVQTLSTVMVEQRAKAGDQAAIAGSTALDSAGAGAATGVSSVASAAHLSESVSGSTSTAVADAVSADVAGAVNSAVMSQVNASVADAVTNAVALDVQNTVQSAIGSSAGLGL